MSGGHRPGSWDDIADWWRGEAAGDPTYRTDVHPMLLDLLPDVRHRVVDLGCGEGQGMRLVGGCVVGVDSSVALLASAAAVAPSVAGEVPDLGFFRDDVFDTAYAIYLVDLLPETGPFFRACARVVAPGGALVIVINHPVFTAPGAIPLADEEGEVLWRWGDYFRPGWTEERAGSRLLRFHHRSIGDLLTSAAAEGWRVEEVRERPLSEAAIAAMPGYDGQDRIPRLLGVRWRLDGSPSMAR